MGCAESDDGQGQGFPPTSRLTHARQFNHVFATPQRVGGSGFVVLFRANDQRHARLGLAISKKCAKRAVDRARLKRIARESFRSHRSALPGFDIIVLCARGAPSMPNQRLFATLERAWVAIEKQSCAES